MSSKVVTIRDKETDHDFEVGMFNSLKAFQISRNGSQHKSRTAKIKI